MTQESFDSATKAADTEVAKQPGAVFDDDESDLEDLEFLIDDIEDQIAPLA